MVVLEGTRFTPVKDLGAGAMGRVTLVRDERSGELVALKRLHEAIAQQGGARLRREFRSLERIQHECVVKVLGYGDEDGIPFLVMEYVSGSDLNDVLNTRPSTEALIRVFIDVAAALGAVHACGIVHRDLKPENIRVTPEGRAKLMDFGLAKSLDGTVVLTRAGAVVGTVLYMSPEQCRGAALDYRADLYALGAVMYWAFAGRAPFIGEGLAQVVMQHLQTPPTPPRVFNAALPAGLERLMLALLSKNPADRPASAAAVIDELARALTEPLEAAALSLERQPRADALLLAGLIGRDAELGMLLPLLEEPNPVYGVYAVTGDVGIGKTRLLRGLSDEARGRDAAKFAFGEAIPDDPTPFGAISRLMHSLGKAHRNLLDHLPDATRSELSRIAPSVFEATAPLEGNLPPEVARLRLFEAFTELLERASEVTVLVIENLHWADESTLALLAHATRAATKPRLILSYRLEDLAAGQTVPKGLTRPRVTIALSALPDDAMRELLSAWLDGDIDPALQGELVAQASGNPWVLEERLKAMLESGAVFKRGGVYEWNHSVMSLPDSLNDLLSHRIMSLPLTALEFARAASVLGKVWLYADVVALLEWDDDGALDALEALTRARLVREVGGTGGEGFRFTHPLYSEMLLDGLMSLKRRRLHSKAAKLLQSRAAPLELAYHHYFAQEYAASLLRGLEAGRDAQATFAYPQAERAYRLALDASAQLSADLIETLQTKHHLAEVLSYTGRNEDALLLWQEVLNSVAGTGSVVRTDSAAGVDSAANMAASSRLAGEVRVKLARVQRFLGSLSASRSLLGELSVDDPFFEELKLEQSLASKEANRWSEAQRYGLEALAASKRSGNIGGQVRALAALSSLSALTGKPRRAAWLAQVAVNISEQSEDAFLKTEAWNELGRRHYDAAQHSQAMTAWQRAAQYAVTTGDLRSRAGLEINIAAKLMSDFDFDSAGLRLREARKLAARAGLQPYEQAALYNLGHCEYALSRLEIARECFADVKPSDDARLWETRISLELGDGLVYELPVVDPSPFSKLLEVQWALSFGDYSKAWALTESINAEYPWAWAVCRTHAGWRLGRDTRLMLETLRALSVMEEHLEIAQDTAQRQVAFMKRAVLDQWTPDTKIELTRLAQEFRASSLGLLARDVLLCLSSS